MRVLSFVQKPYDLIANLEYLHTARIPVAALELVIIGAHANAKNVQKLCEREGIPFRSVREPDIYATFVAMIHARWKNGGPVLALLRAMAQPFAWLYWFRASRMASAAMKDIKADLILSDPWRSKCLYWACLRPEIPVVLHDGGYSTIHFGLLPAFAKGGARAMVAQSLRLQTPRIPEMLRRKIAGRVQDDTPFFTCYPVPAERDPRFPFLINDFSYSRAVFAKKQVSGKAMILGIPQLRHIDTYVARTLDEMAHLGLSGLKEDIEYRFHPSDLNRARLDADYRRENERGVTSRGMTFSYPTSSLEFDFLALESLPRLIVCYETSSLIWLQALIAESVIIVVLPER